MGGVGTDFFRMSDLPAQTFSSAAASERSEGTLREGSLILPVLSEATSFAFQAFFFRRTNKNK